MPVIAILCATGCSKSDVDNLEWNKKIAVAYVHSYAISIGAAVTEMKDDILYHMLDYDSASSMIRELIDAYPEVDEQTIIDEVYNNWGNK